MKYLLLSLLLLAGCSKPDFTKVNYLCITPMGTASIPGDDPNVEVQSTFYKIHLEQSQMDVYVPKSLCVVQVHQ